MQMCPKTFVTLLVMPHLALVKILTGQFTLNTLQHLDVFCLFNRQLSFVQLEAIEVLI